MTVEIVFLLHANYGNIMKFERFAAKVKQSIFNQNFDYKIVLLLKGYSNPKVLHTNLADISMIVPDTGRDLSSYFYYIEQSSAQYLIFFNTSSELNSDNFITSCISLVSEPNCGAASATASWGTIANPKYFLELLRRGEITFSTGIAKYMITYCQKILLRILGYKPTPHLRTNAFACRKSFILEARRYFGRNLNTRLASLMFESGHRGLSGYAQQQGLNLYVVDKYGVAHEIEKAFDSLTYANQGQVNLAVKDNRTDEYENASRSNKKKLYIATWINSPSYFEQNRFDDN